MAAPVPLGQVWTLRWLLTGSKRCDALISPQTCDQSLAGSAQAGSGGEPAKGRVGRGHTPNMLGVRPPSRVQTLKSAVQGAHGGARLRAAPRAAAPPPMRGLWDAMTGAPPATGLLSLPDDVLVRILRKAAPRPCEARVLFVVPLVCRRLAAVARQPSNLWAEQLITLHRCRPLRG